jgi:L-ribulokinase
LAGQYVLGIDFGSLSGRALLVDAATGEAAATAVEEYGSGFIEAVLPETGEALPSGWTLQDPQDYLAVLRKTIPSVLAQAGIPAEAVIGVGIDFTASTTIPIKTDGTPLSFLPEYRGNKHAYAKKWKHHAAQEEAIRMTDAAACRGDKFLLRYGGRISSEWLFPKLWQMLQEDPDIYLAMDRIIEAADWIVMQLTGRETRNSCSAGYKALWHKREGFPADDYFKSLDPRLEHVVDQKLSRSILPIGSKAGEITSTAARMTGLMPGTAVAAGNVDAHVAVPAVGITGAGQMLMIMGTSTCHMLLGRDEVHVPGICGVVEDGILPGFYGYEAGQSCVGDLLDWFVKTSIPPDYHDEAVRHGISIHQILREKAIVRKAGESGLLALDWWNGNRSVLVDTDLTGLIIGMTLKTRPEEIYRALIEATAYGTREIMNAFISCGLAIDRLFACGGIAAKDPLTMQIYADVTGREITVSDNPQAVALGAAMFGAVAAGKDRGGYDTIFDAAKAMSPLNHLVYRPDPVNTGIYDHLFAEYHQLHELFGRGANDVMKRLRAISRQAE